MYVYIHGKRIRVDDTNSIGKGGEADVYRLDDSTALKIFKLPAHPDFRGFPQEQKAAEERIRIHQIKLPAFPKNLPAHVIAPVDLARDQNGNRILGYTMRFLKGAEVLMRFSDRKFRESGVSRETLAKIFLSLHKTTKETHARGVVMGDFNDLNVLVLSDEAYIIDADSFQFANFFCTMFTEKFVDPLLCDPKHAGLVLVKPHNINSDWYAFAIMYMQCLLSVGPYGGVYIPKKPEDKIPPNQRPLKRITIFHPEVKYPKPAIPYSVLPDELLELFHKTFIEDKRGEFPLEMIESLRWTKCIRCAALHARNICPSCQITAPAAVKEVMKIRGRVVATTLFKTSGKILFASMQKNALQYLYHENGKYLREGARLVTPGDLDPRIRFRIQGITTLFGAHGQVVTFDSTELKSRISVDSFGTLPVFDANDHSRYWIQAGKLMKDGIFAPEYIGDVLYGQTLFWAGSEFGFGFYRAGELSIYFVFDTRRKGINDEVKLPPIRGQLIDSTCCFTSDRVWFSVSMQTGGKTLHQCSVIRRDGKVDAVIEGSPDDIPWLANIRGKCAAGNFMLSATDEGIMRIEPRLGSLEVTKVFPDTEPFVSEASALFASPEGLYVVDSQEIRLLKIT